MLWHAIRAVCVPRVEFVFVVLAANDAAFARHDWSAFAGRLAPLYCGGASRRDSVYNGLVATGSTVEADDWMLVHDAARPCLARQDLDNLIRECESDSIGGLLALPAADTVKLAAKDEAGTMRVASTLDRAQLWLAQTPQMFRYRILVDALAQDRAGEATDEAQAVEALAATGACAMPRLVPGSPLNLKVTWPDDLALAGKILEMQGEP